MQFKQTLSKERENTMNWEMEGLNARERFGGRRVDEDDRVCMITSEAIQQCRWARFPRHCISKSNTLLPKFFTLSLSRSIYRLLRVGFRGEKRRERERDGCQQKQRVLWFCSLSEVISDGILAPNLLGWVIIWVPVFVGPIAGRVRGVWCNLWLSNKSGGQVHVQIKVKRVENSPIWT